MTAMTSTTLLQVTNVSKVFDTPKGSYVALADISFEVQRGSVVAVVGPSGAGKTTTLRCLTGLLAVTSGEVAFNGSPISGVPDGVAAVFQDYSRSLYPWLSARGNVMLPLRARGVSRPNAKVAADEALASVGLVGKESSYPWQLSGGMQQRVALARALACDPQLLVMDEPFASLDAQTRMDLEDLVLSLHREKGVTVLIVTHDIDEAVYLANTVVVLSAPPTTVAEIVEVPLSMDRSQLTTKESAAYIAARHKVLAHVRRSEA